MALLLASILVAAMLVMWQAGFWLDDDGRAGRGSAGSAQTGAASDPAAISRGAYLAIAGNCAACHTARGGAAWAGGRAIATPFGTVYAGNLTPDVQTGLGRWTSDDFWRALHHGRSRDGRFLLPVFPYPQYTRVTRADADDLWAYLRSLPAVQQPNQPAELRFPYGSQAAMAVWRALYFSPAAMQPDPSQSAEWNRGAYLVSGLGHCAACHAERNALGATEEPQALGGGLIPMQGWYAPSLTSAQEAGVAQWSLDEISTLLKTGTLKHASVLGPMAEVVYRSTQHLADADLRAMAVYLKGLPQQAPQPREAVPQMPAAVLARGSVLYDEQCATCHGKQGEGAPGAVPPLAGNRQLGMASANNVIRVVLAGGFPPATAGNPRPYGMPPFGQALSDDDIAAVVSHLRNAFAAGAAGVSPLEVQRLR